MNHPFNVGEVYANRNGSYEVVSVDNLTGKMLIRYLDSGEDQEVTIKLQARIWNNMQLEEQEETRRIAQEEAQYQRGYGEAFTGLKDSDFKITTEGTTWRSRAGLAGLVSQLASEGTPYTFVSWSIYRWPVAFLTHREDYSMAAFEMGSRKAKFTLEIDEANLYYGFYLEKSDESMDHTWDWFRLMRELKSDEAVRNAITHAEGQHHARFIGRMSKGDEHFHFANGLEMGSQSLWDEADTTALDIADRIHKLESIPDDHWGEIYIIGQMPKQTAVEVGLDVAQPISDLVKTLLPVYAAAVSQAL